MNPITKPMQPAASGYPAIVPKRIKSKVVTGVVVMTIQNNSRRLKPFQAGKSCDRWREEG
ncbi:hypothetical protein LPE509_02199 [Legionella pneumophila subsp. pneumophila LPE509]|nr:hypothetical protein LPE509_02199 [Legionella pneumophila subsp. pneumophila LPE509]